MRLHASIKEIKSFGAYLVTILKALFLTSVDNTEIVLSPYLMSVNIISLFTLTYLQSEIFQSGLSTFYVVKIFLTPLVLWLLHPNYLFH